MQKKQAQVTIDDYIYKWETNSLVFIVTYI